MTPNARNRRGFTLLELMASMTIFLIICAAMFGLLQLSQQKYSSESQMSGAFQEARLGLDQIVRDINISGYPSQNMFSKAPTAASYALGPVAWQPGYPSNPNCQVGSTCTTPGDYDVILETDIGDGNGVSWIRYRLPANETTLYRGVAPKTAGGDPVTATSAAGVMVPLVSNVMNNPPGTLLTQITAEYPTLFPGGAPQPVFRYSCATPAGAQPCDLAPNTYNMPTLVSDVDVTLIVMTQTPDMQTKQLKLMELSGRGHRSNPNN
jgi:prepilin-type N-terminal cleavage/methylation domain-containing protein